MKKTLLTIIGLSMMFGLNAQEKVLTMEEAVVGYHLYPRAKYIQWQGDKNQFTYLDREGLTGESADKGEKTVLLTVPELNKIIGADLKGFPNFSWLDGNTLVVARQGKIYHIDVEKKQLKQTFSFPKGAVNQTYSKAGNMYAYTVDNNLYYMDERGNSYAVTSDEDKNIVNGQVVSRNEFGITGGIFWSPDGKKLGFYRKDESEVTNFPLLDINSRTGDLKEIKYPMAGMKSELVTMGVYDIASGTTVFLDVNDFGREQYLTGVTWAPESDIVYIQVLNRGQNHMRLNKYDASTGKQIATLFEEKSDTYVEPQNGLVFMKNNPKQFLYETNNRDGYFNLYLYDVNGKLIKRLTDVDADVAYAGMDRAGKYVYYLSSEVSPVEKQLFRVDVKSGKKTRLTPEEGWHTITMSGDCSYFIDSYSSVKTPRNVDLATNSGKVVRRVQEVENPNKDYNWGEVTLGSIKADDGCDLYYRLIKPMNFDPNKKYPVIHYVYGGPHAQMVTNIWNANIRMWEMYMAQHGYVVFIIDNHGTPNRGKAFEEVIHRQCGQVEMKDQVKGIEWLKSFPWVDAERIGVHGWSYGGFMTISLITNYPDIYKVGVAGGPVIDWKWYEAMYGERYMDSPQENPEGYAKVSLIAKAKDLKGKLLICQGAVDPVVVWQHSLSFIRECIKNNVQVDYFPYPCAEHNVMGRDRIHLMQKVTDYFEDYLK
ncbi:MULTISPECIES: S9 family peptidase [Butyricimonas]|uniref:S9 family peptidase n=1 Tax=Butyricimonas TaxID=574697 RepID=UPI001D085922|nr:MULTISPECIES: DPP IV N-terminal domain-containing protein [Butyricimonas]MCB6970726.1 S9 family peptidase [Butyricimonas synergistica]MCG4517440.1 S9 family peptidase [Butyricimonas sp. DFI.6.44]